MENVSHATAKWMRNQAKIITQGNSAPSKLPSNTFLLLFERFDFFTVILLIKTWANAHFVWFCAVFHQWSSLCSFGVTWRAAHHFKALKPNEKKKEEKRRGKINILVILVIGIPWFLDKKKNFFCISIKHFASSSKAKNLAFGWWKQLWLRTNGYWEINVRH